MHLVRCLITLTLVAAAYGPFAVRDAHAIVFDNGMVNNFEGVLQGEGLLVDDGPGAQPTTVNVLDGAFIGSTSEVTGGSLIRAHAGSIFADTLRSLDFSRLDLLGGSFRTVDTAGDSAATVSGGIFSCVGSGRCMGLFDNSSATINGGVFDAAPLIAYGTSRLTVLGGTFGGGLQADRGTVDVYGGAMQSLQSTNAVLTVYGSAFTVYADGQPTPLFTGFGEIPEFMHGVIDGTLADGTAFSAMPYGVGNNGRIVLVMVPEPAAAALFAAGLALLIALRRAAAG